MINNFQLYNFMNFITKIEYPHAPARFLTSGKRRLCFQRSTAALSSGNEREQRFFYLTLIIMPFLTEKKLLYKFFLTLRPNFLQKRPV
jgi:hypothetical protein